MTFQFLCPAQIVSLRSTHASHSACPLRCFVDIPCFTCPKLSPWFPHSLRSLCLPWVFPISVHGIPSIQGPKPAIGKPLLIVPFPSPTSSPSASSVFVLTSTFSWFCLNLFFFTTAASSKQPSPLTSSLVFLLPHLCLHTCGTPARENDFH